MAIKHAFVFVVILAIKESAGVICGGGPGSYNTTACGSDATCCKYHWSPNGYGCCPLPDATCCSNGYTCCPHATTCSDTGSGWAVVTQCRDDTGRVAQQGQQVCKIGPPEPLSTTKKNCLVIGDSVSIGYTPFLAAALEQDCAVQHSPWDQADGGACETAYGLQCLDNFLSSPSGIALEPDLILFNWGLHDGAMGNGTLPGQNGNLSVYLGELTQIVARLQLRRSKLVFALTSPMICSVPEDGAVQVLNDQARSLMTRANIPTIDVHAAIVGRCGPAPQASCFGEQGCFCPHCVAAGYQWLAASTLAPAIKALL